MIPKPMPGKRGKKSVRIRLEDIAKSCGVSPSTVSRALAGEKGVETETRRRIVEMARRVNYVLPKVTEGGRVILAVSNLAMVDYARSQFSLYVLEGIQSRARESRVEVSTCQVDGAAAGESLCRMAEEEEEVIGVLSLTVDDEAVLESMAGLRKPVVLINSEDPRMRMSSVAPANRFGAELAVEYLAGLGHRRILFLTHPGRRTIERRLLGWRSGLERHGLPAEDSQVLEVGDWLPELGGGAVRRRVAASGLDFTAILAAGDSLAMGAVLELERMGISVPGEVSVVGMDDLPQVACMNPGLTTVHIPMREMGGVALDMVKGGWWYGTGVPACRVELGCSLVERASAGPAPGLRNAGAPAAR